MDSPQLPTARALRRSRRSRFSALAVVAVTAVLALVAGCSAGSGGSSSDGPVTLTYGLWDQTQVPAMKQIISDFHKAHPKINVEIQLTPWDDYWTKLQTSATGGSAPDVFWMTMDSFKWYANGGVLMPLDEKLKQDHVNMNDYVKAVTAGYRWKGHYYGMPKDTNSFGLFYNTKLFREAGVSPPDWSWTWSDLVSAAKKLTNNKTGTYGIAAPLADVLGYYLTIPQAGGYVISPDGKKSGYGTAGTIKGIQFWTDLINKYHVSPTLQQLSDTDALSMFTSGKVAMYYGGSWDPVAIKAVPYARRNTKVAPLPKDLNRTFYANGLANVVFAKTKHPVEAWQFVKFLGSKKAAEIQARTGTVIPAYKGEDEVYAHSIPGFNLQVLVDQLPNARPFPSSVDTAAWSNLALKDLAKAWSGQESVSSVSHGIAQQMNAALAKEPK